MSPFHLPFINLLTQDDKTFNILRKTLGSFLENASDEDFPNEDWGLTIQHIPTALSLLISSQD